MALQRSMSFKGLELSAAYIRLEHVRGGQRQGWDGEFYVFAGEAAANPEPVKVGERAVVVDGKATAEMEPVMAASEPEFPHAFLVHVAFDPAVTPYQSLYEAAFKQGDLNV